MKQLPVLIVGAGPIGLMLAVELARRGLAARVVEKLTEPHVRSKAIGVMPKTLKFLEESGLTDTFITAGVRARGANFYSERRHLGRIGLEQANKARYAGLNLPQFQTELILAEKAAELGVQIDRGIAFVDFEEHANGVTVLLETPNGPEKVEASWLIGCDGIHSRVRERCGIAFEGSKIAENWLSGDVVVENGPVPGEVHVFLSKEGFIVFFPLPDGRSRISLELREPELSEKASNFDKMKRLVAKRLGADIKLSDPSWMDVYNVHSRLAATLRKGRCFLAGDAAHSHSPTGGQGMNNGILDAVELANALEAAMTGGSEQLLEEYSERRRRRARKLLSATTFGSSFLLGRSSGGRVIRDWLIGLAVPLVNRRLGKAA